MLPIVYVHSDGKKDYNRNNFLFNIKDRCLTSFRKRYFIEDLGIIISKVKIPPNFNEVAYHRNIKRSIKYTRHKEFVLAPKAFRFLDYYLLNEFQKDLFGFGVVESIKTILRLEQKTIKNSCIAIFDAEKDYIFNIIKNLSKQAKYIILVSSNLNKLLDINDYIICNYGITPIITNNIKNALDKADFIIATKDIQVSKDIPVWYINNTSVFNNKGNCIINNITYKVPWEIDLDFNPEILGAILSQMKQDNVEEALKYNGITLDKIMFNENLVKIGRYK